VQLPAHAQLVVYRLVQEATTNIARYAQAHAVWIDLRQVGDQVRLEVRDDGRGFDPAAMRRDACGLLGMRYRVQAEQGSLQLRSAPGSGTCIVAKLPALPAVPAGMAASPAG